MIGVDHGIATRLAVICVDEIVDPGYHVCRVLVVAFRYAIFGFEVDHTRKGYAVGRPTAPVCEEECCLAAARTHVGACEMVSAANELRIGGTNVMA